MAGSAVDFVVTTLRSLLLQEATLLGGLQDNLDDIRLELQSIQSFLKDSDRKKDSNEVVRTWVGQVRDIAYDVEDVIDEYMYRMAKNNYGTRGGVIYKTICFPKYLFYNHQIATQLQQIKSKIVGNYERVKRYGIVEEASSSRGKDVGETKIFAPEFVHFVPDNDIVGMDDNKNDLIRWLEDKEPRRMVLSVVGMGGLGKTTLVTKAYNSEELQDCFDRRACVTISQSYKMEVVLQSLLKELYKSGKESVPHNIGQMSCGDLMGALIAYLQPENSRAKRYVIILDDIWDTNVWQHVKDALPDSGCGSRVILTTRKEDVASSLGVGSRVIHLDPLSPNFAWDLFCNRAFWNDADKSCPPELHSYAQSLVCKCEGLPLAIVSIGGLMSLKQKTTLEWKKIEASLNWELNNNPNLERMKNILLHSYNDLPYYLKRCFLYCCVFPEDYIIRRKKLIRLWIAEGFVEERRGLTLEEVADTYLNELICRNMLQQIEMVHDYWRSQSYRMHDLLHELALSIATKENFCMIYNSEEATQERKARRLSIQNTSYTISQGKEMNNLRTFFSFTADINSSSSSRSTIWAFRLLRVLNLQASSIESVPNELTNLFNLRYLSLKDTDVEVLPKSIGKLKNLQTLDLRGTKIEMLPKGVQKMKQLRHLYVYRYTGDRGINFAKGFQAPTGIGKLKSLQSLTTVDASSEINRQVGNLTQLTKFEIMKVTEANQMQLCASIEKMKRLLYLDVSAAEEETLDLESMSSPPPLLQKLKLRGHLKKIPHWIASLGDLSYLTLGLSRISEDISFSLNALSNLVILELDNAYEGKQLLFNAGCFPKLKDLAFSRMKFLEWIEIEEKAMPCLQVLHLLDCRKLMMLPMGIENLAELKRLYIRSMPIELSKRIEGDDPQKVQHIRHVWIDSRNLWNVG